jgi:hypothetical protein
MCLSKQNPRACSGSIKITVHDPTIYTKPWTRSSLTYTLHHGVEPQKIMYAPIDENAFNERRRPPMLPSLMGGSYTSCFSSISTIILGESIWTRS